MDIKNTVVELTSALVQQASVSPDSTEAQQIIERRLKKIGFNTQQKNFSGRNNLWALVGDSGPIFCFSGHTDVVPAGNEAAWDYPAFAGTIVGDYLYGRGTEDMKANIAAMIVAVENFIAKSGVPKKFRIAFLISGDEEHDHALGTEAILSWLKAQQIKIDYCINGEPTSEKTLGDIIKIGRRGAIQGLIKVLGQQGHSAHPQRADNAITKALPALLELSQLTFDDGNDFFQPTGLQITSIQSGAGASNVIPGELTARLNCRFSPGLKAEEIKAKIENIFKKYQLSNHLEWVVSAEPFLTKPGFLADLVASSIKTELGVSTSYSCAGGTSDARFIAKHGVEVIEFGLHNETLHQVNERVSISELEALTKVYLRILLDLAARL